MSTDRSVRKRLRGTVVSLSGNKSRGVLVESIGRHAKYDKVIRTTKKIIAHDDANISAIGDSVVIIETRPLSKTKSWRVAELIRVKG